MVSTSRGRFLEKEEKRLKEILKRELTPTQRRATERELSGVQRSLGKEPTVAAVKVTPVKKPIATIYVQPKPKGGVEPFKPKPETVALVTKKGVTVEVTKKELETIQEQERKSRLEMERQAKVAREFDVAIKKAKPKPVVKIAREAGFGQEFIIKEPPTVLQQPEITRIPERKRVVTEIEIPVRRTIGGETPILRMEEPRSVFETKKQAETVLTTALATPIVGGVSIGIAGKSKVAAEVVSGVSKGVTALGLGISAKTMVEAPPEERKYVAGRIGAGLFGVALGAGITSQLFPPKIPPPEKIVKIRRTEKVGREFDIVEVETKPLTMKELQKPVGEGFKAEFIDIAKTQKKTMSALTGEITAKPKPIAEPVKMPKTPSDISELELELGLKYEPPKRIGLDVELKVTGSGVGVFEKRFEDITRLTEFRFEKPVTYDTLSGVDFIPRTKQLGKIRPFTGLITAPAIPGVSSPLISVPTIKIPTDVSPITKILTSIGLKPTGKKIPTPTVKPKPKKSPMSGMFTSVGIKPTKEPKVVPLPKTKTSRLVPKELIDIGLEPIFITRPKVPTAVKVSPVVTPITKRASVFTPTKMVTKNETQQALNKQLKLLTEPTKITRPVQVEIPKIPILTQLQVPVTTRIRKPSIITVPKLVPPTVPRRLRLETPTDIYISEQPFIILPPLPPIPEKKRKPKPVSFPKGFDVEVRKAGKFYRVTRKPLLEKEAMKFGALITETTPRATFRLVPTKRRPTLRKVQFEFRPERFRRPKRRGVESPVEGIFIEKAKLRIDTPGELRGITFAPRKPKKRKVKRKTRRKSKKKSKRKGRR